MDAERWKQVEALLDGALDRPPEEWPRFLDQACGDEPLRRDVEALLNRLSRLGDFLVDPPVAGPARPDEPSRRSQAPGDLDEVPSGNGRRIGSYRVIREIGRGGMGRVYLAERADGRFEQCVALKLLPPGMETEELCRRFRAETQILAALEHPTIARLIDAGIGEDGEPYLAMEYVEGEPLDRYADRNSLAVTERLRLFLQVLDAVQHAHANLVVHRDLKPSNILVTCDGTVKLLDFGLAKLLADGTGSGLTTRTGRRWMTPEYAAPEQVRGESVTTATDVYQLGAVLYELLSGCRPFEDRIRSPYDIERAVLEHEPMRPSAASSARSALPERLSRTLRGDLDAIILKALRKEPNGRYRSVRAFEEDVERYLAGLPVGARRGTAAYRMKKFVRRHRWGVAASAGFVLLVGGFAAVYNVRVTQERDRAGLEAAKSAQVTAFLVGLFEANDPEEAAGDSVTARELLERGLDRVETLGDQPEVQADMLDVLGRVYHSLGRYDAALPLLVRAVALRRQLHGQEHPDLAESLNNLGRVFRENGDYVAAGNLFREALAMRRALHGDRHREVAESLNNLAMVLHNRGDFEATERLYREALAMRRSLHGDAHPDVATSLNNLGLLLMDQGRYDQAEAIHREALAMRRRMLGPKHLDITYTLNNLALVLHNRGDYDGAEELYREDLAMRRELLGDEHPEMTPTMNNLAALLRDRGEYAAAERLFRRVLEIRTKNLGQVHPHVAFSLHNLASVLLLVGDYEQAEALTREAIRIDLAARGEEHWLTAYYRSGLAASLTGLGRLEEAELLLPGAYAAVREEVGDRNRFTQTVLRRLIELYDAAGRPDRAAEYRERLVPSPP